MTDMTDTQPAAMGSFERYLSVWVALAMVGGIALGVLAPGLGAEHNEPFCRDGQHICECQVYVHQTTSRCQ